MTRLIDPTKLPIHSGFLWKDCYHIATEKCQLVKLEDIENADAVGNIPALAAAYKKGYEAAVADMMEKVRSMQRDTV